MLQLWILSSLRLLQGQSLQVACVSRPRLRLVHQPCAMFDMQAIEMCTKDSRLSPFCDTSRLILMGHSRGAKLSCLLAEQVRAGVAVVLA